MKGYLYGDETEPKKENVDKVCETVLQSRENVLVLLLQYMRRIDFEVRQCCCGSRALEPPIFAHRRAVTFCAAWQTRKDVVQVFIFLLRHTVWQTATVEYVARHYAEVFPVLIRGSVPWPHPTPHSNSHGWQQIREP